MQIRLIIVLKHKAIIRALNFCLIILSKKVIGDAPIFKIVGGFANGGVKPPKTKNALAKEKTSLQGTKALPQQSSNANIWKG